MLILFVAQDSILVLHISQLRKLGYKLVIITFYTTSTSRYIPKMILEIKILRFAQNDVFGCHSELKPQNKLEVPVISSTTPTILLNRTSLIFTCKKEPIKFPITKAGNRYRVNFKIFTVIKPV